MIAYVIKVLHVPYNSFKAHISMYNSEEDSAARARCTGQDSDLKSKPLLTDRVKARHESPVA